MLNVIIFCFFSVQICELQLKSNKIGYLSFCFEHMNMSHAIYNITEQLIALNRYFTSITVFLCDYFYWHRCHRCCPDRANNKYSMSSDVVYSDCAISLLTASTSGHIIHDKCCIMLSVRLNVKLQLLNTFCHICWKCHYIIWQ